MQGSTPILGFGPAPTTATQESCPSSHDTSHPPPPSLAVFSRLTLGLVQLRPFDTPRTASAKIADCSDAGFLTSSDCAMSIEPVSADADPPTRRTINKERKKCEAAANTARDELGEFRHRRYPVKSHFWKPNRVCADKLCHIRGNHYAPDAAVLIPACSRACQSVALRSAPRSRRGELSSRGCPACAWTRARLSRSTLSARLLPWQHKSACGVGRSPPGEFDVAQAPQL